MELKTTVHYCKALKSTGKPVIVGGKNGEKSVKKWTWEGFDKDGVTPVRMEIEFGNSKGKAKASGATTVLKVFK